MDHNLREMGVGDLKVPKEMRRMGEAFYGRAQAYRAAGRLTDNGALAEALERNIYGGAPSPRRPSALRPIRGRRYVISQRCRRASLAAGELHFPDPGKMPVIAS